MLTNHGLLKNRFSSTNSPWTNKMDNNKLGSFFDIQTDSTRFFVQLFIVPWTRTKRYVHVLYSTGTNNESYWPPLLGEAVALFGTKSIMNANCREMQISRSNFYSCFH